MNLPQSETVNADSVNGKHPGEVSLLAVFTLVLWSMCVLVALAGYLFHEPISDISTTKPMAVKAVVMDVELAQQPALPDSPQPISVDNAQVFGDETSPILADIQPESLADVIPAVAMPGPSIAFAVPVDGPVRLAPAASSGFHGIPKPITTDSTPVAVPHKPAAPTRLIAGKGLARGQPEPEYPEAARLTHQEGSVTVTFTIDDNGSVTNAAVTTPCRWPLLNQATLRKVADDWHLPRGYAGQYVITVDWHINDQ